MSLTDAQLGEFKEAFEIFDKEKTGSLTSEQLGAVLRSVGTNPTDEEVDEIASQVQKGGKVDLECVIEAGKIMAGKMAGKNLESECLDAFKVFDENGDGTMPSGMLKHMLANLPAKLEEEELDEIMNEADPKNGGTVDIAAFNKRIFAPA